MQPYAPRLVDDQLKTLLQGLPAVNVEGARGVGKTRTAREQAATFIPLDDPDERQQAAALGKQLLTRAQTPLLLDEWQRMPEVWDRVRRAVDQDPTPGRFILTGSATPSQAPVHTGAGRIVNLRMRPMSLAERGLDTASVSLRALLEGARSTAVEGSTRASLDDYVQEIICSGFPGIRNLPPSARNAQLDTYVEQTSRHDVDGVSGRRVRSLQDWVRAYAAAVSTTATFTKITQLVTQSREVGLASATARSYRDALENLWVLDPVRGWSPSENDFSRLTTADKHQLCDPALAARLLNLGAAGILGIGNPPVIKPADAPRRSRMLGPLFESLVTQSVQVYASLCDAQVRHLRTKAGLQEVDLIVEGPERRIVAIEVKATAAPRPGDTRNLLWLRERLGNRLADAVVVTTGQHAYRDEDGVAVVPASLLGP